MTGHIRERSPGHWVIVIDVEDPKTGRDDADEVAFGHMPGLPLVCLSFT
jgi:hypothetical protein